MLLKLPCNPRKSVLVSATMALGIPHGIEHPAKVVKFILGDKP
jgi:hypothetical protein